MTSPFQRDPNARDGGRRDLGDLLFEERLVTEGVLRAARRLAKRERLPMVVVLLEGNHVSEAQVVDVLTRRTKLAVIDPQRAPMDEDIIREMPYDLAEKHRALPLSIERDPTRKTARLRVALADPLDREAIDEIEAVTGHQVEPVVASAVGLLNAIRFHYRGAVPRGVSGDSRRNEVPDPPEHTTLPTVPTQQALQSDGQRRPRPPTWVTAPGPGADEEEPRPGDHITQPIQPEAEDIPVEVRLKALINVLTETGILSERVYQEALQRLLRTP